MNWTEAAESEFCECGVTLMGDPDESDGLCGVCAGAPHHRDCPCDACEEYWAAICRESKAASEKFNRRLVCTCGWTGPYPEHHHERRPDCEINLRPRPEDDPIVPHLEVLARAMTTPAPDKKEKR